MIAVESVEVIDIEEGEAVFDLTVAAEESFIASGIVVHNCPICMALSGAAFDLNGDPLPGSSFEARLASDGLPIHFSCRCVALPLLVGEGIPEDLSFEVWLRTQTVAEQKDILGERWWAAWQSGALPSLRDRIDQRGRPITLKSLGEGVEKKAA